MLVGVTWRRGLPVPRRGCCWSCRWTSTSAATPVLRFAPSPTGQLHLGGLRTALFNHLFARRFGGRWILRIEDTDQSRLVPGAVEAMQDILRWAGLDYDEGPDRPAANRQAGSYVQSARLATYRAHAQRLLDTGRAYRDFRPPKAVPDDVATRRARVASERYLPPDEAEARRLIDAGHEHVVRLVRPKRETRARDLVYGDVAFPYEELLDDPVLVKSDGWPTYHLANVVDDAEMGVTHVLRGEEWLPSLPLHLALYEALEWAPPRFAHLPLLVNPDGSKLSKRHADVHVESYRARGIEPEALVNFVGLMGFNWHGLGDGNSGNRDNKDGDGEGDGSEVFSMADMIDGFSLDRITHSRAAPNMGKLDFLNRQHLAAKLAHAPPRQHTLERLRAMLAQRWPAAASSAGESSASESSAGQPSAGVALDEASVGLMADILAPRADSLAALVDAAAVFLELPDWTSAEARAVVNALGRDEVVLVLSRCVEALRQGDESRDAVDASLKQVADALQQEGSEESGTEKKKKKKQKGKARLMRPLRLALMGGHPGPTVVEAISVLGRRASAARIDACLAALQL